MKLLLTGMANEYSLENPDEVQYLLVFNKGELRVPVGEEAAREVLRFMGAGKKPANGHVKHATEAVTGRPPEPSDDQFFGADAESGHDQDPNFPHGAAEDDEPQQDLQHSDDEDDAQPPSVYNAGFQTDGELDDEGVPQL